MSGGRIVSVLWLLAPLLAGCSSNSNQPKDAPILGINVPPPKEASPTARGGPDRPLPPLTSPSAATSPAALAPGAVPKLENDRDLRIGGQDSADSARGKVSGVSLLRPTPTSDTSTPPTMQPIVPAGGIPPTASSVDQALQTLEARGVKGFRLEQQRDTGEWRCTCSIPNRQNPT